MLAPSVPATLKAWPVHARALPRSERNRSGAERFFAMPWQAFETSACSSLSAAALTAAAAYARRLRVERRRQRQALMSRSVAMAATSSSVGAALQQGMLEPTQEELLELFDTASGGRTTVSFEEAISLDGVDGVLEEGAATIKELEVIWGDADEAVGFKEFSKWYCDVLKVYDDFLMQDAVAPPDDLLEEEVSEEELRGMSDEQLLEDAPAMGVQVDTLKTPNTRQTRRTLEDELNLKSLGKMNNEEEPDLEGVAAPSASGRQNVEITQLFRQACDEMNLMSYEALKDIPEIESLLEEEDLLEEELQAMWDDLPKKGDAIDVLAFRDLLAKVDELFEYVDEDEEEEEKEGLLTMEEDRGIARPKKRSLNKVKQEMLDLVRSLEVKEGKPCGLGGREETDGELIKLSGELEDIWRDDAGDLSDFDATQLSGDWELIYSTSEKWRRWGSILNAGREIKDAQFEALIQNFSVREEDDYNEYDMEEVFQSGPEDKEKIELCMRGQGSWKVALQQNVVTGEEDLVLKLEITAVEYDTPDDRVEFTSDKTLASQMCRTFSYGFISFIDEDFRVIRTSLTGRSIYLFRKLDS